MARLIYQLASLALLSSTVLAQTAQPSCSTSNQCPEDTPCCSQYGQCGVGAYCLGGCDPAASHSLDSCVPAPVCKSANYEFQNMNGLVEQSKYLGDASKADWVYSGSPLNYKGQLWLTMNEGTVGTLVRSTHYMWYGNIKARLSTAAGAGVVTAFILLGDSKDEIDYEFVGVELESAQTNFYSLGVTNYNNGDNITGLTDVHANMHDYEIDWQPDTITWSIDGKVVRTLDRDSTWNATSNRYSFPQTPCQVQLSLWPAGLPSNGEGTIEWGGGLVTWNSPYMVNGYYYAAFESVEINCYDPPSGANVQGDNSYIYTDSAMTNQSIEVSDKTVILGSLLGTGTNPGNSTNSDSPKSSNVATIPGLTGSGPGSDGNRGDNGTSSGASPSSDSGSGGSYTATGTGSAATGFVQGSDGNGNGAATLGGNSEHALQGSLFAVVVAIIALCVL